MVSEITKEEKIKLSQHYLEEASNACYVFLADSGNHVALPGAIANIRAKVYRVQALLEGLD